MVVKKMIKKWRPWLPLQQSKKFEAKIVVHSLTGLQAVDDHDEKKNKDGVFEDGFSELRVAIEWKSSKANGFRPLRKKSVKKNCTREGKLDENGVVLWDEEFKSVCGFYEAKDKVAGVFLPLEVAFLVFNGSGKQSKKKVDLASPAVLNLADYASVEDLKEFDINVPLSILQNGFKCSPSLCISLSLTELRTAPQVSEEVQRPVMFAPLSPCFGGPLPTEKDATLKSSLRKVKSWTDYVSPRGMKKADRGEVSSDSKFSTGSEDSEYNYPFDTDSFDDSDEGETEESKENTDVQNSCNYGTLMHANLRINCGDEEMVYYSKNKPDVDSSPSQGFGNEVSKPTQSPKFGILAWRKRKLSFRSSPRVKGEPLLKKDYGEEGGDDIDFDRRQLSSDESTAQLEGSIGSREMISEFGDDHFAVGCWEEKEVLSRDGSMKLRTQVFFASIDQRSERAAGESACTALVAVIADWLHSNQGEIPIKSEFDSLIREGSLQWRNLCENETYRERFPDKHFDLETVIEAKIRSLSVVPERSFIGFFHPEGLETEESLGFLHSSMSFDNIWDEICRVASEQNQNSQPLVYIVSWNDHFFLLRVDSDAYYIIDTLGERLYEGCNQAFILKFDRDTTIERVLSQEKTTDPSKEKSENSKLPEAEKSGPNSPKQGSETITPEGSAVEMVVCRGKESCKEYIKSFLAAIPIRELQADIKKGLSASTLVHQRLQIEFNYTSAELEYIGQENVANGEVTLIAADFPLLAHNQIEAVFEEPDFSAPAVADELAPTAITADVPVPMVALAAA